MKTDAAQDENLKKNLRVCGNFYYIWDTGSLRIDESDETKTERFACFWKISLYLIEQSSLTYWRERHYKENKRRAVWGKPNAPRRSEKHQKGLASYAFIVGAWPALNRLAWRAQVFGVHRRWRSTPRCRTTLNGGHPFARTYPQSRCHQPRFGKNVSRERAATVLWVAMQDGTNQ